MAVKYRLVKRKVSDLKGGEKVEKSFASTVYNSNVSLEKVCNLVAMRSSMSSADVKSILDSLSVILPIELSDGHNVDLGELGSFRASVSSSGAATDEEFSVAKNMRRARIIFTPGKSLREIKGNLNYTAIKPIVEECDKPHLE